MSRKGKRIITRRRDFTKLSPIIDLPIEDAFNHFINLKKTEGVREHTSDYHMLMSYFLQWLNETYPDIKTINQINAAILRAYTIYLSNYRYNEQADAKKGFLFTTVNKYQRISAIQGLGNYVPDTGHRHAYFRYLQPRATRH